MKENQFIILETKKRKQKNPAFILHFLWELHHWVAKSDGESISLWLVKENEQTDLYFAAPAESVH